MARAPFVPRLVGVVLAVTLPVACGSSSGGPTSGGNPSTASSPSALALPAGLVAGSYYTFVYPHAPATVGSSGSVLFVDAVNVTFRGSITGLQATQHEQLSIAGDQMTWQDTT